ncbi:hypothetical protein KSF_038950 [Reticulibacter mediterranei]|uniref:Uncharacterized protein n=1 Tax=Reticulibacter mediterranei TaxID=2778369 RepID=A0A8J3N1C8_9CHLR|nr:hypothetical protein [Reticulibacter mediterranei]GHO93847.1 hypothetical protein KSF_038950 [Reticulibacter mediterranei]
MEDGEHTVVPISQNDVLALRAILQFYGTYLMQNKMPSAKRSADLLMLQVLIFKLSYVSSLPLLVEELELMKAALNIFIAEVKRRVSGSKGRDGVLESSEQLLRYIDESFSV